MSQSLSLHRSTRQQGRPLAAAESLVVPGYRHVRDDQMLNRLTGNGNYTWIELTNEKQPVLVSQTLKYFERQLPGFIRVSKSVLLNPAFVVGFTREGTRTLYLLLADGSRTLVSRRRMPDIADSLRQLTNIRIPINIK